MRVGDCAADPLWHRYGERVWIQGFGVLTVRDTGGDIKGRDRFDVYLGSVRHCRCGERVGRARRAYRVDGNGSQRRDAESAEKGRGR